MSFFFKFMVALPALSVIPKTIIIHTLCESNEPHANRLAANPRISTVL